MTNRSEASMHQEQGLDGSEFITQCDEQNYGAVSEVSEITGRFCFMLFCVVLEILNLYLKS